MKEEIIKAISHWEKFYVNIDEFYLDIRFRFGLCNYFDYMTDSNTCEKIKELIRLLMKNGEPYICHNIFEITKYCTLDLSDGRRDLVLETVKLRIEFLKLMLNTL